MRWRLVPRPLGAFSMSREYFYHSLSQWSRVTQVLESAWFESWRRDMRASSALYRAAEGSVRAVGLGTYWTASAVVTAGRATSGLLRTCVATRCVLSTPHLPALPCTTIVCMAWCASGLV